MQRRVLESSFGQVHRELKAAAAEHKVDREAAEETQKGREDKREDVRVLCQGGDVAKEAAPAAPAPAPAPAPEVTVPPTPPTAGVRWW